MTPAPPHESSPLLLSINASPSQYNTNSQRLYQKRDVRINASSQDSIPMMNSYHVSNADAPVPIAPTAPSSLSIAFSIAIMVLISFLDYVLFAIIFPSLLYYIQSFGGNETFYSWTLFGYSLAQAISAPILGYWANQRTFKEVIAVTLALEVVASVVYALAQEKWMIFASRVCLGVAAGSSAVTKAYFSAATTRDNRTMVMTLATAAQALGFVAGPGIGGSLAFIDITIREANPRIVFDKFTMAGWFSAGLGLICAVLAVLCLKQPVSKNSNSLTKRRTIPKRDLEWEREAIMEQNPPGDLIRKEDFEQMVNDDPQLVHYYEKVRVKKLRRKPTTKIAHIPVAVLLFCWFTSTTSFTIFETLAAAISKDQYDWDVMENAIMWLSTAAASIVIMALFMGYTGLGPKIPVFKHIVFNDKILCILSYLGMLLGFGIMTSFSEHLHISRWIIGAFFISCAISVNQTLITSLYSIVLDADNQGSWMGYQTTCGCIARIIAPLLAVFIYQKMGDALVFITAEVLLVLSVIAILASYIWIVPHESQRDQAKETYALQVDESGDDENLSDPMTADDDMYASGKPREPSSPQVDFAKEERKMMI